MKVLNAGAISLGLAFLSTTAHAQNLSSLNDIGDMGSGIYQINDGQEAQCYLAIGNYSFGSSGRGYAALSCENGFDWADTKSIGKIMSTDIGDMNTGQHTLNIAGDQCHLLIGNYSFGSSGRGYAAMDCDFD